MKQILGFIIIVLGGILIGITSTNMINNSGDNRIHIIILLWCVYMLIRGYFIINNR